jgi:Plasmid pRiA4b ORF-3-like protein
VKVGLNSSQGERLMRDACRRSAGPLTSFDACTPPGNNRGAAPPAVMSAGAIVVTPHRSPGGLTIMSKFKRNDEEHAKRDLTDEQLLRSPRAGSQQAPERRAESSPEERLYPLPLTEKQRQTVLAVTELPAELHARIVDVAGDAPTVQFTEDELYDFADELDISIAIAPFKPRQCLLGVAKKVDKILGIADAHASGAIGSTRRRNLSENDTVFELKLSLRHVRPTIWRRVEVPDCTLAGLHVIAQIAMGWECFHVHQFIVGRTYYGSPHELGSDVEDENNALLSELFTGKKKPTVVYEYDLGDQWQLDVELEQMKKPVRKAKYPRCTAGELAGPPEDCGGPWRFSELLVALSKPTDPEHYEAIDLLGGLSDRQDFSLDEINNKLREVF